MDWSVLLIAHWPHDRFAFGFEGLYANEEIPFDTYQIFLGIFTIRIDIEYKNKEEGS